MSLIFTESFDQAQGNTWRSFIQPGKWGGSSALYPSTSYARHGTSGLVNGNGASGLQVLYHQVYATQEHATFIMGLAHFTNFGNGGQYRPIMRFLSDASTTTHLSLWYDYTNSRVVVHRGDGIAATGTQIGATANGSVGHDVWNYFEMKATLDDATGTVEVRNKGVSILTLTGVDTKNGGTKTVFDSIAVATFSTATDEVRIDDLYVCNGAGTKNNDFLGDVTIELIKPSNDGATSGMLGSDGNSTSNFALVNDISNDGTYVDGINTGDKDTYAYNDSGYATPSTIAGVALYSRVAKTDTGPRSFANLARLSGTESQSIDYAPNPTSVGAYSIQTVYEDKPGGSGWTFADVNAAEFGVITRP